MGKKKDGYICPACFAVTYSYKGVPNDDYHTIGHCKKCGARFVVKTINLIDRGIIDTISVLNKKGYRTRFSCAGHEGICQPYIYFTCKIGDAVMKEYPVPDSWTIDRRFDSYGVILRSKCKELGRLNDIYNWAIRLPEKEIVSPFEYGYR